MLPHEEVAVEVARREINNLKSQRPYLVQKQPWLRPSSKSTATSRYSMKLPLLVEGSTLHLAEDHDIQNSGHISGGCGGVGVYTREKEVCRHTD